MLLSGIAWGLYSANGRRLGNALAHTTGNFVYASLLALGLSLLRISFGAVPALAQPVRLIDAVISGSLTSALVYRLWYSLLPQLTTVFAATIQLAVPIVVALGAWLFLDESPNYRLAIAGGLVLSGIALTMRRPLTQKNK